MPYEKYKCNKIDKIPLIKNFFVGNPNCIGYSIKAIQNTLQNQHNTKFGVKLIKKTFLANGYSYANWAYMPRKHFDGKGNKLQERRKILEIFSFFKNNVKIYFIDEVKFFTKQLGNRMWASRKLFNKLEEQLKTLKIETREAIVCYSVDGLEGLLLLDSACTNHEFKYFLELLVAKDSFDTDSCGVFFMDSASWHSFGKDDDKFRGITLCMNTPYAARTASLIIGFSYCFLCHHFFM